MKLTFSRTWGIGWALKCPFCRIWVVCIGGIVSECAPSLTCSCVLQISFQSRLKCGSQVNRLLAVKGWRLHDPPRHPLKGAVLLIGHHINHDAPPEGHVICCYCSLPRFPAAVNTITADNQCCSMQLLTQFFYQCSWKITVTIKVIHINSFFKTHILLSVLVMSLIYFSMCY